MMSIDKMSDDDIVAEVIKRKLTQDVLSEIDDFSLMDEIDARGLESAYGRNIFEFYLSEILKHPDIVKLLEDIYLDYTQKKDLRKSVSKLLIESGLLIGPLKDS